MSLIIMTSKKIKMRVFLIISLVMLTLIGCKKESGEGGNSSISGNVIVIQRAVSSNPLTGIDTLAAADVEVYIIYGDNTSPGDRIRANYNGEFEFSNLRQGDYTVYVYSDDTTGTINPSSEAFNLMVVPRIVTISDKKEKVETGNFTIYEDL